MRSRQARARGRGQREAGHQRSNAGVRRHHGLAGFQLRLQRRRGPCPRPRAGTGPSPHPWRCSASLARCSTAIQAVTSRETTTLADRGELAKIRPMLRHYGLRVTGGGLILGAIVAGTSGWLSSLFRLGSPWLVVIVGAVIPALCAGPRPRRRVAGSRTIRPLRARERGRGIGQGGLRDPGHGAPVALGPFRHGSRRPELRRRRRDVPSNDTAAPGPRRALTGRCRHCRGRRHPGPRRPAGLPRPVPAPVSPASHWPPWSSTACWRSWSRPTR